VFKDIYLYLVKSELRVLVMLALALCIFLSLSAPQFLTVRNGLNILQAGSIIAVLAAGAAFVIAARGIDLSVGAVASASVCIAVQLVGVAPTLPGISIALSLVCGSLFGLFIGYLIGTLKLQPLIATLAGMGIARGIALIVCNGRALYGVEPLIVTLGQEQLLGIPLLVICASCICIAVTYLFSQTVFGLRTRQLGDHPEAFAACGLSTRRHLISLYTGSGILAAVAGIFSAGRVNAADPSAGTLWELSAITAAILGGARLSGGRASIIGAVGGGIFMALVQNGLNLHAVPGFYQHVVLGCVLIVSALMQQRVAHA
jgi:ribose transport system permease protein